MPGLITMSPSASSGSRVVGLSGERGELLLPGRDECRLWPAPAGLASRPSRQARSCISASDSEPAVSDSRDQEVRQSARRSGACSRNGVGSGSGCSRGCTPSGLCLAVALPAPARTAASRRGGSGSLARAGARRVRCCRRCPCATPQPAAAAARPVRRRLRQGKPGVAAGDELVRLVHAGGRRHNAGPERQHGLDQPGCAGCGLGVADVRLDGPERRTLPRASAECAQGAELCRIVRGCSGPVPFNELNVRGIDACALVGALHGQQLGAGVRLELAARVRRLRCPSQGSRRRRAGRQRGHRRCASARPRRSPRRAGSRWAPGRRCARRWWPGRRPWRARSARAGRGRCRRRRRSPRPGRQPRAPRTRTPPPGARRSRRCRPRGCRRGNRNNC